MKHAFALVLALAGTVAQAHEPLPSTEWCSSGRAYAVAQFQFTPAQIQSYADCLRSGMCVEPSATARGSAGGCSTQHCGEFDDDYGVARRMAYNRCSGYSQPTPTRSNPDRGSAIELIFSPGSFNSASHHQDYAAGQRLDGQCVRCGDIVLTPPPISTR
jgi:hypothetical protein